MVEEMIKYPLAPENFIVWFMLFILALITPLVIYDKRKKIKWYFGMVIYVAGAVIKAVKEDIVEKKQELFLIFH